MLAESGARIGRDSGWPKGFAWHRYPTRLFTLTGTSQLQDKFSIYNERNNGLKIGPEASATVSVQHKLS